MVFFTQKLEGGLYEAKGEARMFEARIAHARTLLKMQGYFLLLYDVIASRAFAKEHGVRELYLRLHEFHDAVNAQCANAIVTHEIGIGRNLARFETIVGDGGGAYFSNASVIEPILELAKRLPFKLRWAVVKDGWDEVSDAILK